jgi:RNA polymerase sigma-70 factor (ECF subfamily)
MMQPARLAMPLAVASSAPARETVSSSDRLTALFHQHFDLVWRTVRRLGVPPEAIDDAAQEVFVIASRRLASIEPGKERAFLYGTAVRVASTARRTRSRRRQADPREGEEARDPVDTAPAADELVDQKRARELLDELVARLPDDTRPIFVLYELEGLTMDEIATCLDVPPGTVASRLRRAREVFQAAVAKVDRGSATLRVAARPGEAGTCDRGSAGACDRGTAARKEVRRG